MLGKSENQKNEPGLEGHQQGVRDGPMRGPSDAMGSLSRSRFFHRSICTVENGNWLSFSVQTQADKTHANARINRWIVSHWVAPCH